MSTLAERTSRTSRTATRRPWRRAGRAAERGTATAETAVALPGLLMVLAVCVWALGLVAGDLRCAEAARAAARAAARGESPAAVSTAASSAARRPARVTTSSSGGYVTVRVSWELRPPIPLLGRLLPPATVAAEASVRAEPREAVP